MLNFKIDQQISRLFIANLQMAGILFDKFFLVRLIIICILLYFYLYHIQQNSYLVYYSYFFSNLFYFCYLFVIFFPKLELTSFLISKFGEEKTYMIHKFFLSVLFLNLGLSFIPLSLVEREGNFIALLLSGSLLSESILKLLQTAISYSIILVGAGIKMVATVQLGIDGYYWKDLFLRKKTMHFQSDGIYKYFKHPMYGIGNISIYGMALYYNSFFILMMGLFYHTGLYLFYSFIEKPHMKAVFVETHQTVHSEGFKEKISSFLQTKNNKHK